MEGIDFACSSNIFSIIDKFLSITLLPRLTHLLLDCPAYEPHRPAIFGNTSSIYDLWSRPWDVARLLVLRGVSLRLQSIKRSRVAAPPPDPTLEYYTKYFKICVYETTS